MNISITFTAVALGVIGKTLAEISNSSTLARLVLQANRKK